VLVLVFVLSVVLVPVLVRSWVTASRDRCRSRARNRPRGASADCTDYADWFETYVPCSSVKSAESVDTGLVAWSVPRSGDARSAARGGVKPWGVDSSVLLVVVLVIVLVLESPAPERDGQVSACLPRVRRRQAACPRRAISGISEGCRRFFLTRGGGGYDIVPVNCCGPLARRMPSVCSSSFRQFDGHTGVQGITPNVQCGLSAIYLKHSSTGSVMPRSIPAPDDFSTRNIRVRAGGGAEMAECIVYFHF
jgi:hypothetical protein